MTHSERPVQVGIVGTGNISATYVATLHMFDFVRVKAVTDLNGAAAAGLAGEFGIDAVGLDALIDDPEIELVINLTTPVAHAAISRKALLAGKHVYSEKPLGITMEEAEELVAIASRSGLRLGCAPDTFLGGGHQLTRRLLDEGAIGQPVAATALLLKPGHEHWHPNPAFFYARGGGPMLDVGPYYVTNLIALFGSATRVVGMAKRTRAERPVLSEPRRGEIIKVDVPTHTTGVIEFENGTTVTIIASFDIVAHKHNQIEIYGSEGSMITPDPNMFTGDVEIFRRGGAGWQHCPVDHPYVEGVPGRLGLRGLGAAEMVDAYRSGRPHRVSAELALHALEIMTALERSQGQAIAIKSRAARPEPIAAATKPGHFA
ncbi:Gfo/Idh/MocA family oxidoreductase [Mesorhizobium sp. BR1-1-16]|uniref:Gfo/Idh/MocA family protein n=1 Tax=Mesorhizobium sp. BR1-1-16 TaxID=2876653 RepID=UPI001CCBDC08|nr:Gfo/Idh/MocA family oxidoreductase [Mesorhizobium sp. BR1-1-16]MBZ9937202.1 Gfo/Idh/MocA family oxidoreductase [Mesorhizobium sp. BR1-1-16]